MSLSRKVTTLTASIIIYDHDLTGVQMTGLLIALAAMLGNFIRPQKQAEDTLQSTETGKMSKSGYSSLSTDAVCQEIPNRYSMSVPVNSV